MTYIKYLIAICVILTPMMVNSAIYYVRTDGHDSCDGLTNIADARPSSCAWLTIQKGFDVAVAGDTVRVQAGTYGAGYPDHIHQRSSGTALQPITFIADGTVIINAWLKMEGFDYNIINGFTFYVSAIQASGVVLITGNNNQITSCRFEANGGIQQNGIWVEGNNNTVNGNTFVALNGLDILIAGSNNTISDNVSSDGLGDFINLWGDSNLITRNEVYGKVDVSHTDLFQTYTSGVSTNHIIDGNYFHDNAASIVTVGTGPTASGWRFSNNLFINIQGQFQLANTSSFQIVNNTFINTTYGTGDHVITTLAGGNGEVVKNNLFIGCGYQDSLTRGWYADPTTHSNNYVSTIAHQPKTGIQAGDINGNGVAQLDSSYKPVAGASIINAGADLSSTFTTDKDGHSRPCGPAWDIGAYEFCKGVWKPGGSGAGKLR